MELGCNAQGYSRAGEDTTTWYCAVLVGRLGPELDKMREVGLSLLLIYDYDLLGHGRPFTKLFQQFYVFVVFLRLFSITTYTLVLLILHINEILSFFFLTI
jgi:hypothetical protein